MWVHLAAVQPKPGSTARGVVRHLQASSGAICGPKVFRVLAHQVRTRRLRLY